MFLRCILNTVIEQPWAVALMKLKWRATHFTEGRNATEPLSLKIPGPDAAPV